MFYERHEIIAVGKSFQPAQPVNAQKESHRESPERGSWTGKAQSASAWTAFIREAKTAFSQPHWGDGQSWHGHRPSGRGAFLRV